MQIPPQNPQKAGEGKLIFPAKGLANVLNEAEDRKEKFADIAGAADDTVTYFRIFRDVSDANDTAAEDARLLGCKIFFTTDAENDA